MDDEIRQVKIEYNSDIKSVSYQTRGSNGDKWQNISPENNLYNSKYRRNITFERDAIRIINGLVEAYGEHFVLVFCGPDDDYQFLAAAIQQGAAKIFLKRESLTPVLFPKLQQDGKRPEDDESNSSSSQEKWKENQEEFQRTLLKTSISIKLAMLHLKHITRKNDIPLKKVQYKVFEADDIERVAKNGSLIDKNVQKALESQNLIAGYDTEFLDGSDAVYFFFDGILLRQNRMTTYIKYKEINSLTINLEHLELFLGDKSIFIIANSCFNLDVLKIIREILTSACSDFPNFENEDTEQFVFNILCERVKSFVKSPDSSKTYTRLDFYDDSIDKKLRNALHSYAKRVLKDDAIAFIDTSLFSNGKDGILFTANGIAFDYAFEKVYLLYKEIDYIEQKKHDLVFHGFFSNMKDPNSLPSISDIYFKLSELKTCIDEICLHF